MKNATTFILASLLMSTGLVSAQVEAERKESIGAFEYYERIDPFTDEDTSFIGTYETSGDSYNREILFYRCTENGFESLVTSSYLGSDGTAPVEFRFDKKEPSGSQMWDLSTEGDAVFVPTSALATWVNETRNSNSLVIRMIDFNGSAETHAFSLEGFSEAISRLSCAEGL